MYKPVLVSPFGIPNQFDRFEKKVSIFIDNMAIGGEEYKQAEFRVLISGCEPPEVYNPLYNEHHVFEHANKFDLILTSNQKIIEKCPNAKLFPFGSSWVEPISDNFKKEYELSFLAGVKNELLGHKLRQEILKIEKDIKKLTTKFYPSFPGKKDEILYPSMFSIIVENTQYNNYFTEKLIDCLLSKTIPLYWGCPNIENYFNKKGIITFSTIEELKLKIEMLNDGIYNDKKEIIEENFEISKKYSNFWKRVSEEIKLYLK